MAKLIKLSDDVFNGFHPNGIDTGYIKEGNRIGSLELGQQFTLDFFHTSRITEILEDTGRTVKFKTKNSTYELVLSFEEAIQHRSVQMPNILFKHDFISVDNKVAISAEGIVFKIGDVVKHSGDEEEKEATIESFSLDKNTMDVMAHTKFGVGRICFLYF
jgi:hypothetical protein